MCRDGPRRKGSANAELGDLATNGNYSVKPIQRSATVCRYRARRGTRVPIRLEPKVVRPQHFGRTMKFLYRHRAGRERAQTDRQTEKSNLRSSLITKPFLKVLREVGSVRRVETQVYGEASCCDPRKVKTV